MLAPSLLQLPSVGSQSAGTWDLLAGRWHVKGRPAWKCWCRAEGGESGLISVTPWGRPRAGSVGAEQPALCLPTICFWLCFTI